ncbi:HNH endonuclease signature motif containing protein [Nonomuraea longispora]
MERKILIEAGHRCAIPTCRATPVEIAHIDPWAKVLEHRPENLIALCPTCHTRYDRHEIDRQSMLAYKRQLQQLQNDSGHPTQPLIKSPYMISTLVIVDEHGIQVPNPFKLSEGSHNFECMATYVDGSSASYDPYWTCPLLDRRGKFILWAVLGRQRRSSVAISASMKHERYTELACWVFPPDGSERPPFNPCSAIGFDYSYFDSPTDE